MFEAVEQGSSALSLTLGNKFCVSTWIRMPLEMGWDKVFCKILQRPISTLGFFCEPGNAGFDLPVSNQGSVG